MDVKLKDILSDKISKVISEAFNNALLFGTGTIKITYSEDNGIDVECISIMTPPSSDTKQ